MTDLVESPGDVGAFFDFAYERGWTDGLPVIPPTPDRVAAFVSASVREADDVIAVIEPRRAEATVERIACAAVMAGCRPEYMSVLIAMVEAVADPEFNLAGVQTTTNPCSPMVVVNGPVRRTLEMNSGRDALGPGNRANATLGRALRLICRNVGGAISGDIDKATLGMPGKYTFCLAEAEEDSPWPSLAEERGYRSDESVVTVFAAQGTTNIGPGTASTESILSVIADGMAAYGTNNYLLGDGHPVVVLPPGHAQRMSAAGWSKADVRDFLWERSAVPLDRLIPMEDLFHGAKFTIVADRVYCSNDPAKLTIVVAGGREPYHVTYMPNFGDSQATSARVA